MKKNHSRKSSLRSRFHHIKTYIHRHKILKWSVRLTLVLVGSFLVWLVSIYVFSLYYNHKHKHESFRYGVTFIPNYARYLGVDPKETMLALRDDLGFKRFRLVSYWGDIEKQKDRYDFSELDWQFKQVEAVNGEVTLAIGLRQPRWPECHYPQWAKHTEKSFWYPELKDFIKAVVERYKDKKVLVSYQLENEHMLGVFGECNDFGRERLQDEFNLVKALDSKTPVIMSLANNYFGVPTGQPRPDQYGVSVYKRVFDSNVTNNYFEYPFPAWYYGGRAGMTEAITGRDSMIHELQAEPWPPIGMIEASVDEQNKSMDAERLGERLDYARRTSLKTIDLWGGEWWYWRLKKFNDPSLWNTVKNDLNQ